MDLGRSWALFGKGLGRSWEPFGHFWPPLGRFGGVRNRAFLKHWSKMGSKRASGSILDQFGINFGRILGGFGRVLGGFGPILGWIWDELGGESGGALTNLKKAGAESLNRTPALLREASQCAGVLRDPPA